MVNPGNGRGVLLCGRLALSLRHTLVGLASAPEAPVEAVEVAATVPEAPGAEKLEAEVSEVVALKPEASEPGSLEVFLSVVVGLLVLGPNPQQRRP